MPESGYWAVFLVGLMGGAHCLGMCGGIATAQALAIPKRLFLPPGKRTFALPVLPRATLPTLSQHAGRLTTYTCLGAALGGIGSAGLLLEDLFPVQMFLYLIANALLIGLGLYLTGYVRALAWLEQIGSRLWRRLVPTYRRLLAMRSPLAAFPIGLLWGLLPCGMVYSVLATALVSGSVERGAGLMLAFGLGTLPSLLAVGAAATRLRTWVRRPWVRRATGFVVLATGAFGLANATTLGGRLWQGVICRL